MINFIRNFFYRQVDKIIAKRMFEIEKPPQIDLYSFYTVLHKLEADLKVKTKQEKNINRDLIDNYNELNKKYEQLNNNVHQLCQKQNNNSIKGNTDNLIIVLDKIDQLKKITFTLEPSSKIKKFFFKYKNYQALLEGLEMLKNNILSQLKNFQVTPITANNKKFNSRFMKAVEIEHNPDIENNMVTEEYVIGYKHKDFIIRYSEVKVNKTGENGQ